MGFIILKQPETICFAHNAVLVKLKDDQAVHTGGGNDVRARSAATKIYIKVKDGGNNVLWTDVLPVSAGLTAEFEISEVLKSYLYKVTLGLSFSTKYRSYVMMPYKIEFGNYSDGSYVYKGQITSRYAMDAGLAEEDLQWLSDESTTYFTSQNKHLMTWRRSERVLSPESQDRMCMLNTTSRTVRVCYFGKYKNGTTFLVNSTLGIINANFIIEVPLSPLRIQQLHGLPDTPHTFDAYFLNSGNQEISQRLSCRVDDEYYETQHFFMYRNAWGVWEEIWTNGEHEKKMSYKHDSYVSSDEYRPENKTYNHTFQRMGKVTTGFVTNREHLIDFRMSEEIYEVRGNSLLKIEITDTKERDVSDSENLIYFQFSYKRVYNNTRYSNLLGER